jgi:hypothetical protein
VKDGASHHQQHSTIPWRVVEGARLSFTGCHSVQHSIFGIDCVVWVWRWRGELVGVWSTIKNIRRERVGLIEGRACALAMCCAVSARCLNVLPWGCPFRLCPPCRVELDVQTLNEAEFNTPAAVRSMREHGYWRCPGPHWCGYPHPTLTHPHSQYSASISFWGVPYPLDVWPARCKNTTRWPYVGPRHPARWLMRHIVLGRSYWCG